MNSHMCEFNRVVYRVECSFFVGGIGEEREKNKLYYRWSEKTDSLETYQSQLIR